MVADTATDARERIVFLDHPQGIVVPALADQCDVSLGALSGWAGIATGRNAKLFNSVGVGSGLRIELVGSALMDQSLVKATGDDDRADVGTLTATGAFVHVDVARVGAHRGRKSARRPLQFRSIHYRLAARC